MRAAIEVALGLGVADEINRCLLYTSGESLTDELFAEVALLHVLLEPEFADRAHTCLLYTSRCV